MLFEKSRGGTERFQVRSQMGQKITYLRRIEDRVEESGK